ncbi:MarR family winged helix-turn-helix transcriptional regulator [Alteromonas lipolytica]|uniref:HTH marR-type domain-containing protein n=1 Tax=Alteromonas lipolytica TaxID=1856405 RepID=A0A1E8FDG2_9ALTE|nr:MarR family transcriptional regulator [Alteromonas lipolytica]OFI33513.1 hypothetical protein BFC17_04450 [Alteromonas lipolytica]GGF58999.1 hypothetical protein GCM10011338_09100 [Alteromonas lipolytica]
MDKKLTKNKINWGRTVDFLAAQLRSAQMGVYNHFVDWFSATGLSPKKFGVLYVISLNPGVNQRQLANVLSTERAAFGETLARLEEMGLIERQQCQIDKRAKVATITPKGSEVLESVLEEISEQEASFTACLSDPERQMLIALLLKVNARIR